MDITDALADYLSDESDDDTPYNIIHMAILSNLTSAIIEPISRMNYLRVCINVIHVVTNCAKPETSRLGRIKMCIEILRTFPELQDLDDIHFSTIETIYRLAYTNKLDYIRRIERNISCFRWFFCCYWCHF